jgi:hypothetical protein
MVQSENSPMHNSLRKAVFGLCLAALILCAAGEAPATSVDDFFYAGRCVHRLFMPSLSDPPEEGWCCELLARLSKGYFYVD